MSHFTVMVKVKQDHISGETDRERAESAVENAIKMMAPYQEYDGEGSIPEKYVVFEDLEEEWRKEYEEKTMNDGTKLKDEYKTFEEFVEEWQGGKKDPETGKYGYRHNPNGKWDWFIVGGRWFGYLRVKGTKESRSRSIRGEKSWQNAAEEYGENECDVAQIRDVEWGWYKKRAEEAFEKVWIESELVKKGERGEFTHEDGEKVWLPTALVRLIGLGYCHVEKLPEDKITGDKVNEVIWDKDLNKDQLREDYGNEYLAFGTYAVLDDEGWHEKGKMGWFGTDDSTPERRKNWNSSFREAFIENEDPETYLVIMDCHV